MDPGQRLLQDCDSEVHLRPPSYAAAEAPGGHLNEEGDGGTGKGAGEGTAGTRETEGHHATESETVLAHPRETLDVNTKT